MLKKSFCGLIQREEFPSLKRGDRGDFEVKSLRV
jgi:hypothetical protein